MRDRPPPLEYASPEPRQAKSLRWHMETLNILVFAVAVLAIVAVVAFVLLLSFLTR